MRRQGGMADLSALVRKVYPKREPTELRALRAYHWWQRAVSERVLLNARPVRLQGRTLILHTTTGAWANTLQLESTQLLQEMRARTPNCPVDELRFRVGKLPDLALPMRKLPEPAPVVPLASLPDDVARELARIRDDKLRESVGRAVAMGLGRRDPRSVRPKGR